MILAPIDALALGDDARRAGLVVMQRDRKRFGIHAHSARSRKCPARRRRRLRRFAVADHDIAGLKFGAAQCLAQLRRAGAQLRRGRRPFRPHPHRGLLADKRNQCVNRTGRLDVERETRPPYPLGGLDLVAAAIARNLELRHRGALRRHKREFRNASAAPPDQSSAPTYRHDPATTRPAAASAARSRRRYRRAADARLPRAARPARASARRSAGRAAARRETAAAWCWCWKLLPSPPRLSEAGAAGARSCCSASCSRFASADRCAARGRWALPHVRGTAAAKLACAAQARLGPEFMRTARRPRPGQVRGGRGAAVRPGRSRPRASPPSADCSVWRSTISAALRSGTPLAALSPRPATPRGRCRTSGMRS